MRATSAGWEVIVWPWRAKRITMVYSSPYRANGAMRGRNLVSYHSRPRAPLTDGAGEVPGHQRDAEEDGHRLCDPPDRQVQPRQC